MKKCIILFLFSIPIFSHESIGFFNITNAYKIKSLIGEEENPYIHNSDSIFVIRTDWKNESKKYQYNIQFDIFKKVNDKEKNDFFYLGENLFFGISFPYFQIILGRKLFQNSNYNLKTHKDGSEGLSIESQLNTKFSIHFHLVDYYRAYPLLIKEFILNPEVSKSKNGNRLRHGFSLNYTSQTLFASIFFRYLNLKNWGNFSEDDPYLKDSGDGDYIYHAGFNFNKQIKNISLGVDIVFSRGLDKATYHPNREENSIPVSGESINISIEYKYKIFYFSTNIFLPDRDKRTKEGELLETGFIGMGTHPGNSILISQYLNYYPAAWVTQNGMQKNDAVYLGRRNSLWIHVNTGFKIKNFLLHFKYDYYVPYKIVKSSTGTISVKRENFEKYFIAEGSIGLRYDAGTTYFLEIQASRLLTTNKKTIVGNYAMVRGGIWF